MAWIKFEKDLLTDPRVLRIAKNLEQRWQLTDAEPLPSCNAATLPAVTLVCGALVRIWCLADTHVGEDDVLPLGIDEINEHIGIPGFCELLPVDWLVEIDNQSVKLPNFHAHNGTEAKKRAVTQKRVAKFRSSVTPRNAPALPDQTKTRPDKTRGNDARVARFPDSTNQQSNGGWWKSDEGIDAKGKELGMAARPGESYAEYKDRLFQVIADRKQAAG